MKKNEKQMKFERFAGTGFIILSVFLIIFFIIIFVWSSVSYIDSYRSFISNEQRIECKDVLFFKECKITYVPSDAWKHDLCFNNRYFLEEPVSENSIVYTDKRDPKMCSTSNVEINLLSDNPLRVMSIMGLLIVIICDIFIIKSRKGK